MLSRMLTYSELKSSGDCDEEHFVDDDEAGSLRDDHEHAAEVADGALVGGAFLKQPWKRGERDMSIKVNASDLQLKKK